jgi:hypothetical protein
MVGTIVVDIGFSQLPIVGELIEVRFGKVGVEFRVSDHRTSEGSVGPVLH